MAGIRVDYIFVTAFLIPHIWAFENVPEMCKWPKAACQRLSEPEHPMFKYNCDRKNPMQDNQPYSCWEECQYNGILCKFDYCTGYGQLCINSSTTPADLPGDVATPPPNATTSSVNETCNSMVATTVDQTAFLTSIIISLVVPVVVLLVVMLLIIYFLAISVDKEVLKCNIKKACRCNSSRSKDEDETDIVASGQDQQQQDLEGERNQIEGGRTDNAVEIEITGEIELPSINNGAHSDSNGDEDSGSIQNTCKEEVSEERTHSTSTVETTRTHRGESSLVSPAASSTDTTNMSMDQLMKRLAEAVDPQAYICVLNDYITEMNTRKEKNPDYWEQVEQKWKVCKPLFKESLVSTKREPRLQRMLSNETTASENSSSQSPAKGLTDAMQEGEDQPLLDKEEGSVAAPESIPLDLKDVNFTDIKLYDIKLIIMIHMATTIKGAPALES